MAKKDIKKNSDSLARLSKSGKVKVSSKDKQKYAERKESEKKAGPVKKAIKKVKDTLPSKKVIEDKGEFQERQRGSKPRNREQYVADKKAMGQKPKPRIEISKGWGKNAPKKARKMDE